MRASLTPIRPGEVVGMTFMTKKLVLQQIDRSFLQRTGSCSPVVPTRYLSNNSKGAEREKSLLGQTQLGPLRLRERRLSVC